MDHRERSSQRRGGYGRILVLLIAAGIASGATVVPRIGTVALVCDC